MARGRIEFALVRCMAISANEIFVLCQFGQLSLKILALAYLIVAASARGDRHIGSQTAKTGRFGNVDMTRSAFIDVLLPCVSKLH